MPAIIRPSAEIRIAPAVDDLLFLQLKLESLLPLKLESSPFFT